MRASPLLVTVLLLVGSLAALASPSLAQGGDACAPDPANDVQLLGPGTPQTGPGAPVADDPADAFKYADVTSVCVGGESNREFVLTISIAQIVRNPDTRMVGQMVDVFTCFSYTNSPGLYRVWTRFSYNPNAFDTQSNPVHSITLLSLVDACPGAHVSAEMPFQDNVGITSTENVTTTLDAAAGTISARIIRHSFTDPALMPGRAPGVAPKPGDQIKDIQVTTRAWAGSKHIVAQDESTPFSFGFTISAGETGLRLVVPANINRLFGITEATVPAFGVDVGSFQTVPLEIYNALPEPVDVNLSITLVRGDAASWDVRIIPSIPVAGASGGQEGNTTVTLIVNSAPSIKHKESVRIEVKGQVTGKPEVFNTALLDVIGVVPPDVARKQLYFHGVGRMCAPQSAWWINTLAVDPQGPNPELAYQECAQGGGSTGLGGAAISFRFRPDVEHARHYTLDALQGAVAHVAFKSSMVVNPPTGMQEVVVPARGTVTAELLSGDVTIGKGEVQGVDISNGQNFVDVPIKIFPENRLSTTRYVPNERPLNVVFTVQIQEREFVVGNEQTGEQRQSVPTPSATIRMMLHGETDSSFLTVPILGSERAGDVINVTKSGAFVSLRATGDKLGFMNPGKTKVFTFTVRNEGLNPDTVKISATLNRTGWQAKLTPATTFKLGVGDPATFQLDVRVPETAVEEESARIDVLATSKVDPEATALVTIIVKATRGTIFPDERPDFNVTTKEKKDSPSAGLFGTIALLGALAAAEMRTRRRRGE